MNNKEKDDLAAAISNQNDALLKPPLPPQVPLNKGSYNPGENTDQKTSLMVDGDKILGFSAVQEEQNE
jgi:hypothetical protein